MGEEPTKMTTALKLFTTAEVASICGVSRKLVSQWIRDGALPAIRLGPSQRLVRIRQGDLETFLKAGETLTFGSVTENDDEANDQTASDLS